MGIPQSKAKLASSKSSSKDLISQKTSHAATSLDSALKSPLNNRLVTVIHLGSSEICKQVVSTGVITADFQTEALMLVGHDFREMCVAAENDAYGNPSAPTPGLGGSGRKIAKQLIRDWGNYNRVAFEEVLILVRGVEVGSFLKIRRSEIVYGDKMKKEVEI